MNRFLGVAARVLLASIFLGLVFLRITAITSDPNGYEAYQALLGHFGLPGIFAPLIILIQLVGGFALLLGFKVRFFAYLLAGFSLFMATVLGSLQPEVLFLYLGITGGLLSLAQNPASAFSLDGMKK